MKEEKYLEDLEAAAEDLSELADLLGFVECKNAIDTIISFLYWVLDSRRTT